jgi:hypothetical protein
MPAKQPPADRDHETARLTNLDVAEVETGVWELTGDALVFPHEFKLQFVGRLDAGGVTLQLLTIDARTTNTKTADIDGTTMRVISVGSLKSSIDRELIRRGHRLALEHAPAGQHWPTPNRRGLPDRHYREFAARRLDAEWGSAWVTSTANGRINSTPRLLRAFPTRPSDGEPTTAQNIKDWSREAVRRGYLAPPAKGARRALPGPRLFSELTQLRDDDPTLARKLDKCLRTITGKSSQTSR